MNNTIQLYADKEKKVKAYPITSPDRVVDENGVSIKKHLKNNVKFDVVTDGDDVPEIDGVYDDTGLRDKIRNIKEEMESKANYDTVFTMANMGQDIKKAMTGGSVAVVDENSIIPINVVKNSLTAEEVDFLTVTGKNLYNYKRTISDTALNLKGELEKKEGKFTSELISAKSGDIICMKKGSENYNPYLLCFYGANGFISYTPSQFCTAPEGTTHFRFTTNGLHHLKVFKYKEGQSHTDINEDYFESIYLNENVNVYESSLPYSKRELIAEAVEESKNNIVTKDNCDFIRVITSKNLCNTSKLKNGFYLFKGEEQVISNKSYYVTDYIPVKNGQIISGNGGKQYICLYDTTKKYVSQVQAEQISATCDGFVRFTVYCNESFRDKYLMICYGNYTNSEVTGMYEKYHEPKYVLSDVLISSNSIENLQNSRWKGKNLVVIGDSITECTGANEKLVLSYPYRLRDNLGFGSLKRCCYWGKHYYDFDEIVKHSVGITDGIEATIVDGQIREIKSFKEADLFICFLGQNDTENVGNITDEKGQGRDLGLIANIKYWIEYCLGEQTGNPDAEFVFVTPTPSLTQYLNNLKANREAIKNVAEFYNVKCIDMFGLCGFNAITQKNFYTTSNNVVTDAVHPTLETGHRRMYEVMRNGIGY